MGVRVIPTRLRPRMTALAVAAAVAATGGTAGAAATAGRPPPAGVVHRLSAATQQATRAFWTPSRVITATPERGVVNSPATPAPPPGTPTATLFNGVPTVGTLFFTTGTQQHFCTASVVNSPAGNVVLTAAHCVYGSTYASNIEFVPEYHDGLQPYGAWVVTAITVATGWQQSQDPNLDFAFLSVAPPAGTSRPIQYVTGGLWLGIDSGYNHHIEVIGYNNTDDAPVGCVTKSFEFEATQMEFYCHDYWDGTSGGPWIFGYNARHGTGTVFGVIGGYEQGGDYEWASYSAYFGPPTLQLFLLANRA
jgi:V8-like Glu-specific endopeptidase